MSTEETADSSFSCYACGLDELTMDMQQKANVSSAGSQPQQQETTHNMPRPRSEEFLDAMENEEEFEKDDQFEDSERVETSEKLHRRSVSAPPHKAAETRNGETSTGHEDIVRGDVIPTLPRYPVAETRNKNCWSEPPVSIFHVRGKNYLTDKKKFPSGPYLLSTRGSDLFLCDNDSNSSMDLEDM